MTCMLCMSCMLFCVSTKEPVPAEVSVVEEPSKRRRTPISQTDIPRISLKQALRVPRALAEHYARKPVRPLDIAAALEMSPTSGPFRELCGAAIGYGLTEGGPNASLVALTPLGQRVVAPLEEGDDNDALRASVLVPSVQRQFLEKYDGSPLPAERIGQNVLEAMGVPTESSKRVYDLIRENAAFVGYLKNIKDKVYVDLADVAGRVTPSPAPDALIDDEYGDLRPGPFESSVAAFVPEPMVSLGGGRELPRNRKVFVSHGKSKRVVDQLKELLTFGDFEPVIPVERETVSKPVPQKVMDDMRACGAGIIHVRPEEVLLDRSGSERRVLNENVLIEIGAAMALFGQHFILLVEEGTTLPSNLQGLYEVRYVGDELGYDATMKVLKALNQFKTA
jgi:hypothetical protein